MSYAENLSLFFVLLFGIIIVPGMDMLFIVANALSGGRKAGLSATAGVIAGGTIHTLSGLIGIGLLLRLAPSLFNIVLLAGAAYMAWIGVTLMRSAITVEAVEGAPKRPAWTAFRQGAITCLLNPKAYLFTASVFPQFVRPQYGPLWSQGLAMGLMVAATQLSVYGGLALAAGKSRDLLTRNPGVTMAAGRAAGVLLIVAAALTAWEGLATR
ncbi:LysE family translocator [Terrarubrum flagellatum]|uniref:LysE family translocator n=1 Tax=Terrirubrum flagellatum TaxID=2895980 RepID=UPI003144EF0C